MREVASEVLILGAGPAGLAAAAAAAEAGARVDVIEGNRSPGGQIWRPEGATEAHPTTRRWQQRLLRTGVRVHLETTVVAADGPRCIYTVCGGEMSRFRTSRLVLATGSRELFLPFPGWTLPGVTGVGGLQALVKSGWPIEGKRVVVAGSGPLLLAVADSLRRRGAKLLLIAEQAPRRAVVRLARQLWRSPRKAIQALGLMARLVQVPMRYACWPLRATGDECVRSVLLQGSDGSIELECDALACGFGLVPEIAIAAYLGCDVECGAMSVDAQQQSSVPGVYGAGEITGVGGVELAVAEGAVAGTAAAGARVPVRWLARRDRQQAFVSHLDRAFALRPELRRLAAPETIVCRCEDVAFEALAGAESARAAKLATRCGMGSCQGRVCGPATRFLFGWHHDRVRPPFFPVPMAALAAIGTVQPSSANPACYQTFTMDC